MPSKKKKQKTHHTPSIKPPSQAEIWDDSALIKSWNEALAEYEYYHSIHARGEDVEEILRKAEEGELDDEDDEREVNGGWQPVETGGKATDALMEVTGGVNGSDETKPRAEDDDDEEGEIIEVETAAHAEGQIPLELQQEALLGSTADDSTQKQQEQRLPPKASAPPRRDVTAATTAPLTGPSLPLTGVATDAANANAPVGQTPSQDQTLENIKMAYYWAGYYSGLHDGQRQASTQSQSQAPL